MFLNLCFLVPYSIRVRARIRPETVLPGALFCAVAFQPKHTDYVHPDEPDL